MLSPLVLVPPAMVTPSTTPALTPCPPTPGLHHEQFGIFLAIVCHKGLAALALGSTLLVAHVTRSQFLGTVVAFSLATPLGVGLGLLISAYFKSEPMCISHTYGGGVSTQTSTHACTASPLCCSLSMNTHPLLLVPCLPACLLSLTAPYICCSLSTNTHPLLLIPCLPSLLDCPLQVGPSRVHVRPSPPGPSSTSAPSRSYPPPSR